MVRLMISFSSSSPTNLSDCRALGRVQRDGVEAQLRLVPLHRGHPAHHEHLRLCEFQDTLPDDEVSSLSLSLCVCVCVCTSNGFIDPGTIFRTMCVLVLVRVCVSM